MTRGDEISNCQGIQLCSQKKEKYALQSHYEFCSHIFLNCYALVNCCTMLKDIRFLKLVLVLMCKSWQSKDKMNSEYCLFVVWQPCAVGAGAVLRRHEARYRLRRSYRQSDE